VVTASPSRVNPPPARDREPRGSRGRGGTVHAGGLYGCVHAGGNRVITCSLRGCRGSRVAFRNPIEIQYCNFLQHMISSLQTRRTTRRERVARLFQDRGAGFSPCAGTPLLKRPVGTRGAATACRTRCPKEPHAQRSWHLQRSLPAQSKNLRTEVCGWPSLSDDERLVQRRAVTGLYVGAGPGTFSVRSDAEGTTPPLYSHGRPAMGPT
jgi:hypothetical protein